MLLFQKCEDLILEVEFQDKKLYWNQMNKTHGPGPMTVGTDYGNCCFFAPQINFGEKKLYFNFKNPHLRKCFREIFESLLLIL